MGAGDVDLLLGAEATERSLRLRPLQDYRVISFATHAIVAGEIPGTTEPALVLTPMDASSVPENGLLTATKIARLGLDANLVDSVRLQHRGIGWPRKRARPQRTRGCVLLSRGASSRRHAMGCVLVVSGEVGFRFDFAID